MPLRFLLVLHASTEAAGRHGRRVPLFHHQRSWSLPWAFDYRYVDADELALMEPDFATLPPAENGVVEDLIERLKELPTWPMSGNDAATVAPEEPARERAANRYRLAPPEGADELRVPVKIVLEPGENRDRRLRPGMNVVPNVYLR